MADENDTTDKTEDPTQKRLDDAQDRGDVAKSQEINTWFMIAGATLVLSTFSRIDRRHRGAVAQPDRQFMDVPHRRAGPAGAGEEPRICRVRSTRRAAVDAGAGGDRRQHDSASAGVVGRIAQTQAQQDIAGGRRQADLRQAGGGEFRQGPLQGDGAGRGDDGDPLAGAPSPGIDDAFRPGAAFGRHHRSDAAPDDGGGGDARGGRDRRLFLPVPAMVRAAEDVAAGDEGRVQAIRRRPAHQGPDQGSCARRACASA